MELFIDDIPEEGMTIEVDSEHDAWIQEILTEYAGDHACGEDHATLALTVLNCEDNIDLRGELKMHLHLTCDRCLEPYDDTRCMKIHMVFSPNPDSKSRARNFDEYTTEGEGQEGLEFSYYDGDRIDVGDMIREHVLLDRPAKNLCHEECAGSVKSAEKTSIRSHVLVHLKPQIPNGRP